METTLVAKTWCGESKDAGTMQVRIRSGPIEPNHQRDNTRSLCKLRKTQRKASYSADIDAKLKTYQVEVGGLVAQVPREAEEGLAHHRAHPTVACLLFVF